MHLPPNNKLDPQQLSFLERVSACVENYDFSNQWIKGFAGSGKSVLLAYTAKIIISKRPGASILVVVFTRSLQEMFRADFRALGILSKVEIVTTYGFMKRRGNYDYILCDEVQDLPAQIIASMNSRGKNVIVAGDCNQSIYKVDPYYHEPTVCASQIASLINGDSWELNIIHRLTRSVIDAVQRFLPQMRIFDSKIDLTKGDTQIRICEASSNSKEVEYVMSQALKAVGVGDSTVILIPTVQRIIEFVNTVLCNAGEPEWSEVLNQYGKPDFDNMNSYLESKGIMLQYVGNGYGSFNERDPRIVIMTFHSAKGLDFENVYIPYANSSMFISSDEPTAKVLFMVAMTRSRKNLCFTYNGSPSKYLDSFKSSCSRIDISSTNIFSQPSNDNPWGF